MSFERNDYYRDLKTLRDECKKCLYYHTILTMTDGSTFDGIIENVDDDNITVMVGEDVMEGESNNPHYYYETYEDQRDYRRPRRRFRRFRRRSYPLAALATLGLLPYVAPLSYPYYPYPYF